MLALINVLLVIFAMGEGGRHYNLNKLQNNLLLMWHFEIISCSAITVVVPRAKYIQI